MNLIQELSKYELAWSEFIEWRKLNPANALFRWGSNIEVISERLSRYLLSDIQAFLRSKNQEVYVCPEYVYNGIVKSYTGYNQDDHAITEHLSNHDETLTAACIKGMELLNEQLKSKIYHSLTYKILNNV